MDSAKYFILIGIMVLVLGFAQAWMKKIPVTTSIVYLLFGILIGPHFLDLLNSTSLKSKVIEVLTEITVIISLFTVGLKMRLPLSDGRWKVPFIIATLGMTITICLIAIYSHLFLELNLGYALLFGAIMAPTDPVLASDVQVEDPSDKDTLKLTLTGEGGMNDGAAFPFVMLGLGLIGTQTGTWSLTQWFIKDLLWAILAGLGIGAFCGYSVSAVASQLHPANKKHILHDFLTIGSIALAYGLALAIHAYGFLAVFASALTMRQIELKRKKFLFINFNKRLPDEALSFNEQLERIFEVLSVTMVGALINLHTFSLKILLLAVVMFFIIRPLAVIIATLIWKVEPREKLLVSWLGIRGIGSVYYLYFAINHGGINTEPLLTFTLWIVFLSILFHGVSVKPVLKWRS